MRKLKRDWITEYVDYISPMSEAPTIYHWWSAACVVGATLKRNVWIERSQENRIYPNQFVVLVGRPGLGKTIDCINPIIKLLQDAGTANILSDKLTIEYVLERLSKGWPMLSLGAALSSVTQGKVSASTINAALPKATANIQFGRESCCMVAAGELSVFIKKPEDALPILNQLWDAAPGKMQYGTRYKSLVEIDSPCQSLLGGSAPQYLAKSIPNDAVGGGFTRRVNFVYSNANPRPIYFSNGLGNKGIKRRQDLICDLQEISKMKGRIVYEDQDAENEFVKIRDTSKSEEFDDEATSSYKTSRWVHALKLATTLSASRGDSGSITVDDLKEANQRTLIVAADIQRVFRGVGTTDLVQAADAILRFVENQGYATEGMIKHACWRHLNSSDDLTKLLTLLTTAQPPLLLQEMVGAKIIYKPVITTNP